MKSYIVSYYIKLHNREIAQELTLRAESAKEARAGFVAAYEAAKTGCHAFRIKVRLDKRPAATPSESRCGWTGRLAHD